MKIQKVQISIRAVLILIAAITLLLGVSRSVNRILPLGIVFNLWFFATLALPSLLPLLLAWFTRSSTYSLSFASLSSSVITALYTLVKFTTNWGWDLTGNFSGMVIFALPFSAMALAVYLCIVGTSLVHVCRMAEKRPLSLSPTLALSLVILILGGCVAILYGEAFIHWPQPIPG